MVRHLKKNYDMYKISIVLILCKIFVLTEGEAPSDNARHKLVSLLADVRQADGYRYSSHDHLGNSMDCVKIIKRTNNEDFIGVYHTFTNNIPRVNLAISNDLLNWTWIQELGYMGSQPTIAVPIDQPQGYIVAWEQEPNNHVQFLYYPTWSDLQAGNPQKNFSAPQTLSRCAEGTPNIYGQPTLDDIDVGFHFYDNCIVDRQARGNLKNFNQWTNVRQQPNVDQAILSFGVHGNIGDRDGLANFSGYEFTIIEGQYTFHDFGSWRSFIYDHQTGTADEIPVNTARESQAFANPTMTLTTWNNRTILIGTLFVPSEKSGPGEAGELIYYHFL